MTHKINNNDIKKFTSIILDSSLGCTEMRTFYAIHDFKTNKIILNEKYKTIIAGWYENGNDLYCDLTRLDRVSAYVTVNPVSNNYLQLKKNGFMHVNKGQCVIDDMINMIRFIYIDIDSIRVPKGIPATDDELAATVACRDSILSDHSAIARDACWGTSGNGSWILIRVDYPNDERHRGIVGDVLGSIATKYSKPGIEIDSRTRNPSRVMCVPGTLKCKGIPSSERPWRLVTLDGSNL